MGERARERASERARERVGGGTCEGAEREREWACVRVRGRVVRAVVSVEMVVLQSAFLDVCGGELGNGEGGEGDACETDQRGGDDSDDMPNH